MRRLPYASLVFSFVVTHAAILPAPGHDTAPPDPVIALHNGDNDVDLLGDGSKGRVFVAWRGNFNGHGFSDVSFDVRAKSDLGDAPVWQVIPFFGAPKDGETGHVSFQSSEGADCILGDIRVVRHAHQPVEVIVARRGLGTSFADPAPVDFDYYALVRNTDAAAGWPVYYFKRSKTVHAARPYCDVNEAFRRELSLGARGVGHAEGGR